MMHGSLPARLRVLRARQGLTLIDAAKQIGIGRDTLSDLERGNRHPVMPTLAKIAEGYGVPVEELLEEEPVPLGEVAGRDLPGSIEGLLERRHTKTRHLADPNLLAALTDDSRPLADAVLMVRE